MKAKTATEHLADANEIIRKRNAENADLKRENARLKAAVGDGTSDPVLVREHRDHISRLNIQLRDAERRASEAENIRRDVLGLKTEQLVPRLIIPPKSIGANGRTVILHLSDVQYGETVLAEEMDGLNRFDAKIANARLGTFFSKAGNLMTKYWKGDPPDEIVLCLGGDLISGNIHDELARTNQPAVPHAVRDVAENIAGGILHLRKTVKAKIRVLSVPGNHGRTTMKPQSKGRSASSLDLLATDFCEAVVRGGGVKDIPFYKSTSPDVCFSTYGWNWMLTHGDTMGGRGGGQGYIGPAAVIIKGHRKLVDTSGRTGRGIHYVLTGHYHTTLRTTFGWANGSVIGYNEYARDLRCDPESAKQNLLVVHPRHGVIRHEELYLGTPEQGSMYGGPANVARSEWQAA
jgi:hypothetical protein